MYNREQVREGFRTLRSLVDVPSSAGSPVRYEFVVGRASSGAQSDHKRHRAPLKHFPTVSYVEAQYLF
eukprot:1191136-Prorocentrum_minimum.AAC.10